LGEDDSEFICAGCNSKTQSTPTDLSMTSGDIHTAGDNHTVVIDDDGTVITDMTRGNNTDDNNSKLNMTDNETTMDITPDNNNQMETIGEDQPAIMSEQQNPKKPSPVARGSGRITKITNNHNRPRPNRSTKQGEFFITRFELRVNIRSQTTTTKDNNLQKLRNHLVEIVTKLVESNKELKIVPWKEKAEYEEIDAQNIPHNQPGINKFFYRISPRAEGFAYADIRIKHKRASKDITHDISLWLSNQQHGLYFQTLQSEETANIGWLLWSFRKIDSRKLEEEIWDL
jgi:hypothetical protein